MNDTLVRMPEVVEFDPEFLAVGPERFHLVAGEGFFYREVLIFCRYVVVGSCCGAAGVEDAYAALTEAFEGLGAGNFVNEVAVDEYGIRITRHTFDDVAVPDLFKNCFHL